MKYTTRKDLWGPKILISSFEGYIFIYIDNIITSTSFSFIYGLDKHSLSPSSVPCPWSVLTSKMNKSKDLSMKDEVEGDSITFSKRINFWLKSVTPYLLRHLKILPVYDTWSFNLISFMWEKNILIISVLQLNTVKSFYLFERSIKNKVRIFLHLLI